MQTNLERENEQLKMENQRLVTENASLKKEKQRLSSENAQLKIEKTCMANLASIRKQIVTRSGRSVVVAAAAAQLNKDRH